MNLKMRLNKLNKVIPDQSNPVWFLSSWVSQQKGDAIKTVKRFLTRFREEYTEILRHKADLKQNRNNQLDKNPENTDAT